jgi:hypothetical protein
VAQFEPGYRPAAAPPPAPPCGQPFHEPEPTAVFRVLACSAQLRHPSAAAIGDLYPDSAGAGRHRDRDRLPGNTRAAVPEAIGEKLAREQDSIILAGVPRAEDRAHETADNPSPLHQPGNLHALANRRPRHQRTAFPPAREDPQGPNGRAGKSTLTSAAIVKPNAHHWRLPQKGSPAHLSRYSSENRASQAGDGIPSWNSAGRRIPYYREKCLTMPFHFTLPIAYTATSNAG